jgi:hypothetical protein
MSSSDRLKALMVIWGAFALASGLAFVGNAPTNSPDIVLAMVFAAAAVLGTGMVMYSEERVSLRSLDKVKRSRPDIYEMVDSLDDEELRLLRQRLMSDSDTGVPLQDLMSRRQNQSQK